MARKKDYSDVPHFNLIRENETIEIDSVFQFKGGYPEMHSFLNACQDLNCTVHFDNEDLTVSPGENRLMVNTYAAMAVDPRMMENYMIYLMKLGRGEIRPLE